MGKTSLEQVAEKIFRRIRNTEERKYLRDDLKRLEQERKKQIKRIQEEERRRDYDAGRG